MQLSHRSPFGPYQGRKVRARNQLIPIRFLLHKSQVREVRKGTELLRSLDQIAQSVTQGFLNLIQSSKSLVMQYFSEFVPEVLRRVEFRTERRLRDQPDVFRDLQFSRLVPSCTIHQHYDEVATKITRDLFQEDAHGLGISKGKHQSSHLS